MVLVIWHGVGVTLERESSNPLAGVASKLPSQSHVSDNRPVDLRLLVGSF